ncbi:hypothetical protein M422DRAFT_44556 [Sphaerobolus stellatus SS14]|nr:hypothetical protein M422DRAFT_44556 [Sphaerobolus stellatus SS14]
MASSREEDRALHSLQTLQTPVMSNGDPKTPVKNDKEWLVIPNSQGSEGHSFSDFWGSSSCNATTWKLLPDAVSKPEEDIEAFSPTTHMKTEDVVASVIACPPQEAPEASSPGVHRLNISRATSAEAVPQATVFSGSVTEPESPASMYHGRRICLSDDREDFEETYREELVLTSEQTAQRQRVNMRRARPWGAEDIAYELPRFSQNWSVRANFFEKHWAHLDQLINGDSLAPHGISCSFPISQSNGTMDLDVSSMRLIWATPETVRYADDVDTLASNGHRRMNRSQVEFWELWRGMAVNNSHLPIAHSFSDLETVTELLKVSFRFLEAMRTVVAHERRARNEVDELPYY